MSRYSPILTSGGSKVRRVHDVAGEMEIVICYRGVGKTRLRMRYVQDEFKSDWQEVG